MADDLATVGGDGGPEEATAVTLYKSKTAGGAAVDFTALEGLHTDLAAILTKLVAAPATEATLEDIDGDIEAMSTKVDTSNTALTAILAKIITAPATAANQATEIASLASIDGKIATDAAQVLAWDGSSHSTTGYSSAYIEVTTYNTPITVKSGIAANNPMQVLNLLDNSTAATITATGLYVVPAVGNLTLIGLGTGVVNLMLKR